MTPVIVSPTIFSGCYLLTPARSLPGIATHLTHRCSLYPVAGASGVLIAPAKPELITVDLRKTCVSRQNQMLLSGFRKKIPLALEERKNKFKTFLKLPLLNV
jgi:hypothetical protein